MSPIIVFATIAISAALVFYTLGVFGERRHGRLNRRHVVLFWTGLCCDATGTLSMSAFAQANGGGPLGLHAVTGIFAIALMIVHAVWATAVFARGSEKARSTFSRFSIVVWLIWLVPYVCGLLIGMPMTQMEGPQAVAIAVAVALVVAGAIWLYDKKNAEPKGI